MISPGWRLSGRRRYFRLSCMFNMSQIVTDCLESSLMHGLKLMKVEESGQKQTD
ncbi:unnamed protein product, partial [Brassica oleracea]